MVPARAAAAELFAAGADGRLDALCQRYRVRVFGIFGSAARPGPVDPRDVDVAVGFLENEGPVVAMLGALIDLVACDCVDVAVVDGAEPLLRARPSQGSGFTSTNGGCGPPSRWRRWPRHGTPLGSDASTSRRWPTPR